MEADARKSVTDLVVKHRQKYLLHVKNFRDNGLVIEEYRNLCIAISLLLLEHEYYGQENGSANVNLLQNIEELQVRETELELMIRSTLNDSKLESKSDLVNSCLQIKTEPLEADLPLTNSYDQDSYDNYDNYDNYDDYDEEGDDYIPRKLKRPKKEKKEKSLKPKNKKSFKCQFCDKEFFQKKSFRDHLHTHPEYGPFPCHICFLDFQEDAALQEHIKTHKSVDKQFFCKLCPKEFSKKKNPDRKSTVWTPVTSRSRMPSSAWKKKQQKKQTQKNNK